MTPEYVITIGKNAIQTILLCSGPMLIVAMVVGLFVSIFQAATQINEQTMTFIPKIIAVFVTLLIFAPWLMNLVLTFTTGMFEGIATVAR